MTFHLPEPVARAGLGALRAVALADGTLSAAEGALLRASARSLGIGGDVAAIPIASREAVAAVVADPAYRERLVQALIVMAIMDEEVSPAELALIRRYASALGVADPRVHDLSLVLRGHSTMVKLDLVRRSRMLRDAASAAWKEEGLRGLYAMYGGLLGFAEDAALAARHRAYGLYAEGTLGRVYHDSMVGHGFAFPGEKHGFPLRLRKHDLSHVVGGYDIDPIGECEVIAFISGFNRSDPFGYLFMILVHMHLGVEVFPQETFHGTIDPARVLAALERGSRVTADLYDPAFDWEALMPLPLSEVRLRLGITPKP